MEYIWTIIFVTLLPYTASGEYIDRHQRYFHTARRHCSLATPTINFSIEENKIELSLKDDLNPEEKAWVGYIQDLDIFQYFGCVDTSSVTLKGDANTVIDDSIGECQSFCKTTEYIGVQVQDKGTNCYCITDFDLTGKVGCGGGIRETNGYLAFGASDDVAMLIRREPGWNLNINNCYSYNDPKQEKFTWAGCSMYQPFLCSNDSYGRTVQSSLRNNVWKQSSEFCLGNNLYLLPNFTSFTSDLNSPHWTPYTRDYVISKSTDSRTRIHRKYGYIERNDTGHYILKFDSFDLHRYYSLCDDDDTINPDGTSHGTTSSDIGMSSISVGLTQGNSKMTTVRSNANGNITDVSSTEDPNSVENSEKVIQNENNGSSNIGLFIGIPIGVLVVIVAIVLGILFWRKRKGETKSKSAENNCKQNFGFSKYDKAKSSELRPNSAEDYQEIDDINRSSLEDYDTIKEADTAPTNNGINNRGYIAHTLAKRDDIKKSNNYDYAKEPGKVESVVQHTYHVLEKSPHPGALMLERENENGYNYAKVLPKTENQVSTTKSDQRFNVTDADTDYDHLDDGHGMNNKPKTKHRVGDNANDHVYDKTGDTTNTYDHVNNRLDGDSDPRGGNVNTHGDHTNVYNKLTDVKPSDDTYNHVNHGQDNTLDEGDYNTTTLQKAKSFDTDNPYDHTK